MRILLANPNTTEGITALMAAAARATASPGHRDQAGDRRRSAPR